MRLLSLLLLVLFFITACGHEGTGPSDPLVGNWEADPRCLWDCWFTVRSVTDPTDSLNLTNQLSARFELDMRGDGTYQVKLSAPGATAYQDAGRYTAAGSLLVLAGAESADSLDYQLTTPLLHLTFRNRLALLDLNGDGVADTVSVEATLKKF
ncbi:MAG TPA: hypothetical protein VJ957_06650 [Longimicrobiales bacterium]|nr:hypothetical protein [Longimicrobiales bacterium]